MVPARKSTRVTLAPTLAVAVAERAVEEPSDISVPLVGPVRETVGADAATVTLTAVEVTAAPFESVTFAVRETAPLADGVHVTELLEPDAGVLTVPTRVVPEKNSTFARVAAPTELAVAVSVTGAFTVTADPAVGAVKVTLGAVTLTLTIADVTVVPLESVTLAVSEVIPDAEGVQVT